MKPIRHYRSVAYYIVMTWRDPGTAKQRSLSLARATDGDRTDQVMYGWRIIAEHSLLDEMKHEDFRDRPT